jgi:hypothetical protein
MSIFAYHYNQEKIFVGFRECQADPLTEGVYLIPANSTPIKPPKAEGVLVAVYQPTGWAEKNGSHFIDGTWKLVCDYRSRIFWDKTSRVIKRVTVLGEEPEVNWTAAEPGKYDTWNPGTQKWEYSADLEISAKKADLFYWDQQKFNLLKDIDFAIKCNMPSIVEDLQKKLSAVEIKIKSYGNLK